ncbi:unnamed protein product [Onchocerca ochengi]|uniref:CCT domain-containing protein n=1 Tax=Onchocerca ochengi TaxID=42157 RepID=A0A182E3N7_ONCOC|nr:unnamed protein product [Onchocerca ochengi]
MDPNEIFDEEILVREATDSEIFDEEILVRETMDSEIFDEEILAREPTDSEIFGEEILAREPTDSEVFNEEILARGPRDSINASGDNSYLADFSLSNPPAPLCHSTSTENTNNHLENSIFNSAISAIENTNSAGSYGVAVEVVSNPILLGRVTTPCDMNTGKKNLNPLASSKETTTEPSPGSSGHQYWLRERKHKLNAFGDAGEKISRVKNVFKKRRGKKKQSYKVPKKLIKVIDYGEINNNTFPNDDDDDDQHPFIFVNID